MKMKERINSLLAQMRQGIYEKDRELSLSLLAALAGESIILLGPPGVAKSMVARRLKEAFREARSFEYLMSRFSTPDEIFGPVSISQLKSSDAYVRAVDGFLPTADVVFLDEIWKAGPAIQNTLLTVINEKLFRNGNQELHLPLKLLVAASNELPAQGEGLEALWDRFVVRVECGNIQKESLFDQMLLSTDNEQRMVDPALQISDEEYTAWSEEIEQVGISQEVLEAVHKIRRALRAVAVAGTEERHDVYVSDRRWKMIVRLLRTSAFMQDRREVAVTDLLIVYHCLWQEPEERDDLRHIIIGIIFSEIAGKLDRMKVALKEDIKKKRTSRASQRLSTRQMERDKDKKLYNNFYFHLLGCSAEHTYIYAQDYRQLPAYGEGAQQGVLYHDKRNQQVVIVRSYDGEMAAPLGSRPVSLQRDDHYVYIDGVRIEVETLGGKAQQPLPFVDDTAVGERDYGTEIECLADQAEAIEKAVKDNLFLGEDDRKEVNDHLASLRKAIAFTRQDTQKLYD